MQRLLARRVESRLGFGAADGEDVKRHRFFSSVDWQAVLERRTEPPFRPLLRAADDTSNFDAEFTSKPPFDSPVGSSPSHSVNEMFAGFSYSSSSVLQ
jgi:hypothetical protein